MHEQIKGKLAEIEYVIDTALINGQVNSSLASGKAGIVILYIELYEFSGQEFYLDKGLSLLEEIINNYKFDLETYSHCSGLAGLMWLVGWLIKKKNILIIRLTVFLKKLKSLYWKK